MEKSGWNAFKVTAEQPEREILAGSQEAFITEHYWCYTRISDDRTSEYGVVHPRWNIYKVRDFNIQVAFGEIYGDAFAFLSAETPVSIMLAEGSEIAVQSGKKI